MECTCILKKQNFQRPTIQSAFDFVESNVKNSGVIDMKQEEFDGIIRYLDHTIDDDKKIYRQVMTGRDYEAEMLEKAISAANKFLKDDMNFTGHQVKTLLKYIYEVPFND